jgi:hypothetical protein
MPPGSERQQCAGEKDFLTSPGVKRTDILRRDQANRKPTISPRKSYPRPSSKALRFTGRSYQKFLTPLLSQHKVSAVPPPKALFVPTERTSFLSNVSKVAPTVRQKDQARSPPISNSNHRLRMQRSLGSESAHARQ